MTTALVTALHQVAVTFSHTWPYLVLGVVIAAAFGLYADQTRVAAFLQRHRRASVLIATAVAVATPLCSCGTMAVVLGMLATSVPWAPIVAFMVASPLTSPEELIYSAGLFGWPFALSFFAASVVLGLAGGAAAHLLEKRGLLNDQLRFRVAEQPGSAPRPARRPGAAELGRALWTNGRRMAVLFGVFAFLGYFVNGLVPSTLVGDLFGTGHRWGVVLAALLGLPFYVNTEASLPLVRAFLDNGASSGAALAFLIAGAGTSVGAITGALSIARWRVVGLVVGTLWLGSMAFGAAYDFWAPPAGPPLAASGSSQAGPGEGLRGVSGSGPATRRPMRAARRLDRSRRTRPAQARGGPAAIAVTAFPRGAGIPAMNPKGGPLMSRVLSETLVTILRKAVGLQVAVGGCCATGLPQGRGDGTDRLAAEARSDVPNPELQLSSGGSCCTPQGCTGTEETGRGAVDGNAAVALNGRCCASLATRRALRGERAPLSMARRRSSQEPGE